MAQQPFFPDESVSPEEKRKPEWLKQYAMAAYITATALPKGSVGYVSRDEYREIKMYAHGRQTVTKYKSVTSLDQDPNNNNKVSDFTIRHAIPKYRRVALGLMEKESDKYEIRIDPIDPLAISETDKRLLEIKSRLWLKEQLMAKGMPHMADMLQKDNPNEPDDMEGMASMELGARHHTAMDVELLTELVFNANDYDSIKKVRDEDLFDYGFAAMRDERVGGTILLRRCAPERMIMSYCFDPQFKDWKYIGELEKVSTAQLVAMSNGELTKEKIEWLWKTNNLNTNSFTPNALPSNYTWTDTWARGTWTLLDLYIRTTDKETWEESTDKRGNMRFGKATRDPKKLENRKNSGKYKYSTKEYEQVYKVKWVCGTDIVFGCGQATNIKRIKTDLGVVIGDYTVWASGLDDMRAYSRTKALIPYADDVMLASIKLQHALARVVPRGYSFDLAALESVAFTHQGKTFAVGDLIDMFLENGILIYNSTGIPGHNERFSGAIAPIDGGVGNEIQEYWTLINQAMESIRGILGLNDVTDASTPSSKMLVPVANYAASATNNALSDLFYADRFFAQSLTRSIVLRAQDIIDDGQTDLLRDALGIGALSVLGNIKDMPKYLYSTKIEDSPTAEEAASFNEILGMAIQAGQINPANVLQLKNIKNYKQKEEYLAYCIKQNEDRQNQKAATLQKNNADVQTQSATAVEAAKQQTMQMEYKLMMDFEKFKHDLKMEELQVTGGYNIEGKRIDASGRTEASYIQASGRDATNIRDNKTALLKEDMRDKTPEIDIPANLESRVEPATNAQNPNLNFSFLNQQQHGRTATV